MASSVRFHPCFLVASILSYYVTGLLATAHNVPQTQLTLHKDQHIMKFSNGTPPVDIYGSADTGSNLVWTQCLPCDACFKQIHPMFDSKKSSTYREISCQSEECRILLDEATVLLKIFAITRLDMLLVCPKVFGRKKKLPLILPQGGFHYEGHATGTIGFGAGPLSFVSQIGSKRFSYCLVPYGTDPSITGKISFSNGCEVVGDGVISTPYVGGDQYYLTLEGISVGDTYVPFNSSGADVELKPIQTFNRPVKEYEYYCFAITNIANTKLDFKDGAGVYGSNVQANFLIGYDLETKMVSFKPTDCTKL
ncbi:aspartic proteinase CDR1-like [Quercus lobata]|uniref:aspartic proteinase CDR1-like n=1 Tax=Quercus lobata TaxID=97700 RepID=UPI001244F732|nr:aspartic proteinase CDR1-like [Quercus lobata]